MAYKPITCREAVRLNGNPLVEVLENNKVVYTRFVAAKEWDSDPQKVAAELSRYLSLVEQKTDAVVPPVNKDPISLTAAEVEDKLEGGA